jgi:uncharacterized protein YkwD
MFSPRRAATLLATAAALALAAPAGAQASAQSAACPGADIVPSTGNLAQVGQATLCLLNDERATHGLAPVVEAQGLTRPSAAYSARMVAEDFFAHVAPDGATLVDRLAGAGYIERDGDWTVGENIAWGQGDLATARNIVIAWMNSPGHRENILTREYTEIGIGIVPGTPGDPSWGATYTTDFGAVNRDAEAAVAGAASAARTTAAAPTPRKAVRTAKSCKAVAARRRAAKAKASKPGAKGKRVATCAGRTRTSVRRSR